MNEPSTAGLRGDLVSARVLGLLGTQGPTSRGVIARRLGLSPATVTQTTKQLLARGTITELDSVPSRGGRPAVLLDLADRSAGALGVKVAPDHVTLVTTDLEGNVLRSSTRDFDAHAPAALDVLRGMLSDAVAHHDGQLLGVGVGVPGSVDSQDNGEVLAAVLGWDRAPLGAVLREALGVPVLVDNDVHACAAAQLLYGAGRHYETYLVVTIGVGVGSAIVLNGSIHRGAHGGAGEVGHIAVGFDGPRCHCGASGCLEAHVGDEALLRDARDRGAIGPRGTTATLQRAADRGDEAAREVYRRAGSILGRTLSGVANMLDPEAVILLGEGTVAWGHWSGAFEETFRPHLLPDRRDIPLVLEDWTDERWAQGAASLVMASSFDTRASGDQGGLVRERLHTLPAARRR